MIKIKKHLSFSGIKAISIQQRQQKKDTRYHLICQQNQLFPIHDGTGRFPKKERNRPTDICFRLQYLFIVSVHVN